MKKQLNKQIKTAIKSLSDCTPEEALMVSQVIHNLIVAKERLVAIKNYM